MGRAGAFVPLIVGLLVLRSSEDRTDVSVATEPAMRPRIAVPDSGTFELLAYNVAGLPQWATQRRPSETIPEVSRRINGYDLVLFQEDFAHHDGLFSAAEYSYRSGHLEASLGVFVGDGLSRLSTLAFSYVDRSAWDRCNGTFGANFDCWASKGFSFARHALTRGTYVDVYNVHLDAGGSKGDIEAKRAQIDQLCRAINRRSSDRPVVIAGDANLRSAPDLGARLMRQTGVRDACEQTRCGRDVVERVFYRSGRQIALEALEWKLGVERFLDRRGQPLSDHDPVYVRLAWKRHDSHERGVARMRRSRRDGQAPAPGSEG